jgi:hypothetical protein
MLFHPFSVSIQKQALLKSVAICRRFPRASVRLPESFSARFAGGLPLRCIAAFQSFVGFGSFCLRAYAGLHLRRRLRLHAPRSPQTVSRIWPYSVVKHSISHGRVLVKDKKDGASKQAAGRTGRMNMRQKAMPSRKIAGEAARPCQGVDFAI